MVSTDSAKEYLTLKVSDLIIVLKHLEKKYGRDHVEVAITLTNLGFAHNGLKGYTQAYEIFCRDFESDHPYLKATELCQKLAKEEREASSTKVEVDCAKDERYRSPAE